MSEIRTIIQDRCYIVKIALKSEYIYLNKFSEICLRSDFSPNAVYVNNRICLLIFSKTLELFGNHDDIISKYTSIFHKHNKEFCDDVTVSIIEFDTPVKLVFYIKWQIEKLHSSLYKKLSNESITDKTIYFKTNREIYV